MSIDYDILLKNLKIIDGTGAPWFYGDIAIKGDTIVDTGKVYGSANKIIDCSGLYASPGFIDMHNHSDESIFKEPEAKNYTSQGVTTLVTGNCGVSGAPLTKKNCSSFDSGVEKITFLDFFKKLNKRNMAVNIAALVGQGTLRSAVMGFEDREPTKNEMDLIKGYVEEAMKCGAFGMSTGLIYDPGVFTSTDEIIELAKIVGEYDGVYATHMRNESDLLIDSTLEAIKIGKASGARVQISHHKASGKRNYGLVKETLKLMEYYRRFGVEVTCDVYPFNYFSTNLYSLFPTWTRTMGKEEFLKIVGKEENKKRLRDELSRPSEDWENVILDCGFEEIIISSSKKFKEYEGKSIAQLSKELGKDSYDLLFEIILEDPDISIIGGGISEEDMKYVLKHDLSMIGSDGRALGANDAMVHPRNYNTFPKIISKYVREEGVLTLERAIMKMSYLPAWKLGIKDRGLIKPGFKADINIFDLWNVNSKSDFNDPHHYARGFSYVLVNGEFVISEGEFTKELPGKLLRKS